MLECKMRPTGSRADQLWERGEPLEGEEAQWAEVGP